MKSKRLNPKVLIVLLVAVVLFGAGGYLIYEVQSRRNASKLLAQADFAEKQKDAARAAIILDRYLRYRPDDTKALARYGLLQADQAVSPQGASEQEIEAALLVLERVLVRDAKRDDVRRRAIDLYLKLRDPQFAKARVHIDELKKRDSKDGELELADGRCLEAEGKPGEAVIAYSEAVKSDPKLIDAYVRLSRLRRGKSDVAKPTGDAPDEKAVAEANAVMDQMVEKNGQSAEAYLNRAIYRLEYQLPGADDDIAVAEKLDPGDPKVVLVASQMATDRKDWDSARRVLTRGLESNPRDSRLYHTLAHIETLATKLERAEDTLVRGVQAMPEDRDLKWQLAETRIQRLARDGGDEKFIKQIEDQIEELGSLNYPREMVGYLWAHKHFARKEWDKAARGSAGQLRFEEIDPLLIRSPRLLRQVRAMLAQCYTQLGDAKSLYETYRRMAKAEPTSQEIRLRLASTLEVMGRDDEAFEEYRLVTDKADTSPVAVETNLAMARLLIRRNLRLPAGQRNWQEVDSLLDELSRKAPAEPRVAILRAEVLAGSDRIDEARVLLEKARDTHPDRAEHWLALIVLAERRGKGEEISALLDAAEKKLGDRIELRLARARQLATRGGPDVTKKLQALGGSLDKFSPEERGRLLRGLAESLARSGDSAKALALWTDYANQNPQDLNVQLLAFDLALRSGDLTAQGRALKQIEDLEKTSAAKGKDYIDGKDNALSLYCRARQTIAKAKRGNPATLNKDLDTARENLNRVAGHQKTWEKIPLALAEIDEMQGKTGDAIGHYVEAVTRGERDPGVIRRTLQLLADNKRFEQANAILEQLKGQSTISGDMQRLASELQYQNRDYESALNLAEKAVEAGSTDYRDHLWLAQMRWVVGRRAEAEAPMRKAVELAGDDLTPLDPLVRLLVASGKKPEAERAIAESEKKAPAKDSRAILARCYAAIGRNDRANQIFVQALKESPDDAGVQREYSSFLIRAGRSKEAEPYLERLSGLKDRAPKDAEWARGVLAMLLAPGDKERAQRALELAGLVGAKDEGKGSSAPLPLAQLRTQARVLAVQSTKGNSQEAIGLLQEVVRRDPGNSGEERFILARLFEVEGDWPKADEQMRQVIVENPSVPANHVRYLLALLRNKRAAEAGPWLDQLEKLQPEAPLVQQLRAMVLSDHGKGDDAVELLQGYAQRHVEQSSFVAQVLELIGRASAAESVLRRYVTQVQARQPEAVLVLADYLGRQGKTREALDLCQAAWETCPPATVADVCCGILLVADPDDTQVRRVEGWLNAEIGRQPSNDQLQIARAMLRTVQGRYKEAEDLYRKALERNEKNVVALNNLAWMIAIKQEGKAAEALQLLDRAIEIAGPRGPLLDTRAVIHMKMGRTELAVTDLEAAIADSPIAPMYFHLAQALLMANRRDDARTALQDGKRLGLKPNSLDPLERSAYPEVAAALDGK